MDCHRARVWSRICFGKIKEIFNLCRLDFSSEAEESVCEDTFVDEHIFLISTTDPWYGDIIVYLQTQRTPTHLSRDERWRLRHVSKNYLIVDNTLYRHGVDSLLRHCLTHDEAEVVLNDFHEGACGGHLSGLSTTQKILRVGYFWLSIFKDCSMRSRSVTLARCLHAIWTHILPCYIRLSLPVPSPSGGLTSWIAVQLQLGAIIIL